MYQSQQISGAALAAFMPTFTSENGFKGANAQIATLAPYGTAAVSMIALSSASDWHKNRGWYVNFGFVPRSLDLGYTSVYQPPITLLALPLSSSPKPVITVSTGLGLVVQ
jgi:hypothetical protein